MKHAGTLGITVAFLLTAVCTCPPAAGADDNWPTWRGPTATGVAAQGNPPVTWSESENIKWKVEIPGRGHSSPVIWGNKLFLQTAIDTGRTKSADAQPAQGPANAAGGRSGRGGLSTPTPKTVYQFDLLCLDRATGKVLWQKTATEAAPHEGHQPTGTFASYSPVTDGKYVWASFGSRGVYCFDLEGNLQWSQPLPTMKTVMSFGEGSSPAIAGEALIVVCDQEAGSAIFAFNKITGAPLWRQDRDEPTSWATPAVVDVDGKTQVIISATNLIRSYDARTGALIWQCKGQTRNVIPSPVLGFGMVFCTSGYRGSSLQAIKLAGSQGDLSGTAAVAWQIDKGTPYVASPLLYGNRIYVFSVLTPKLSCYEARSGQPLFTEQTLEGINQVYSSPVGVADRVYCPGRNGVTVVLKNADTFEVLAANKLDDGIDASLAVSGDELYLRGNKSLYCIAKK
ncbi:MAG: PQQ-like beta-propeller repeat protein [Planctomycetes bacterium]|jgi:outer membrane protein assembly factor BamB|nr:PQQ-like beta-propeller repeat protein [Planctomycetota bacterium]